MGYIYTFKVYSYQNMIISYKYFLCRVCFAYLCKIWVVSVQKSR